MTEALDAARDAVEAYYAAREALSKVSLYQSSSLGRVDALRALQAHERAFSDAVDALQALPGIGAALSRYDQAIGSEVCSEDVGCLERFVLTGEVGQILDVLCPSCDVSTALDSDICL